MTPEEVRIAVETAIRQGSAFQWWSYAAAFLLTVVGAAVGAYVVKRAQDRATQHNFDMLRDQLRRTTEDTESIKTALARQTWVSQQQWSTRERQYAGLLTQLTKIRLSLQDRNDYFSEPDSAHDDIQYKNERYKALAEAGFAAQQALRELAGPAAVFLSQKAISSLEQMVRDDWNLGWSAMGQADYVSEALNLVETAYADVLAEAKAELARASDA